MTEGQMTDKTQSEKKARSYFFLMDLDVSGDGKTKSAIKKS
jgi:hypothetical protein